MTDAPAREDLIAAVADTLERLQIEPANLFAYVEGLRARYKACVEALFAIDEFSNDETAAQLANETLFSIGAIEGDVSHETN